MKLLPFAGLAWLADVSDASPLAKALTHWEWAEYISSGLVALGCIGEYVADFTNWLTDGDKERKERLAKRSTLLLIAALSVELICLVRTNTLSGMLIGSLSEEATAADTKAKTALSDSTTALQQSSTAEASSRQAIADSSKATKFASGASTLAVGARREADSFEKDIVSAKTQAAEAESHLAEALKQAADATAELNRLKSPRTLTNPDGLISALKIYQGTQYTFVSVGQDEESIRLLQQIDGILHSAGWERAKSPGGFPAINVYGKDQDLAVPVALTSGIEVTVDSSEGLAVLQSLPLDKLPPIVAAAVALNEGIASHISPTQESRKFVNVQPGNSTIIRITVGPKP